MEQTIKWKGEVYGYIKDQHGKKIEGSDFHIENTVQTAFLNKVAARLGGDVNTDIMFLQTNGSYFDTICFEVSGQVPHYAAQTVTKSAGGDGNTSWVEFKGEYTAAQDQTFITAKLVKDFFSSTGTYGELWASATFNKSILNGQTLVVYWRITFTAA